MALTPEEKLKLLTEQVNAANELADIYNSLGRDLEDQNRSISGFLSAQKEISRLAAQESTTKRTIASLDKNIKEIRKNLLDVNGRISDEEQARLTLLEGQLATSMKLLRTQENQRRILEDNGSIISAALNDLKETSIQFLKQEFSVNAIWSYLQKIDGAVRDYQLNLGLSGNKADFLRQQTQESVNQAARYGAGIEDIISLQSGLNDITGRAGVLTEKQIGDMVLIAKGTGMANEEATKLVGNMMLLGSSIEDSKKFIEATVNSTAQLGLSSSNVLKGITANIGSLNKYRFQNGVEGLKKMVQSSEKFKFSIEGAFSAAEKFRTLEGLLEAGANLRVLGGEFAKIDEFKFSFLARNKPEEFAVELTKLTKGMASFNKETGMFDISDIDMDRLRAVAETTGRSLEDVSQSAKQFNQIEFAKKQIFVGTPEEREMLAKLATFSKGSTIGTIQIGDKNVRLDQLTDKQIELYKQEKKTLDERAVESQNFDKSFANTVMQIKSTLLPLLEIVNSALKGFNFIFNGLRDSNGKMSTLAGLIPIGGLLLGGVGIKAIGGLFSGIFSGISGVLGKIGGAISGKFGVPGGQMGPALPGGGMSAASMAAMGVAAVGIGFGFKLAAEGATSLAEAMSKLKPEQVSGLTTSLMTLGAAMVGIVAVAPFIGLAAPELLAFGAAVTLIGAGIGIAAVGIAELVKAFNTDNMNFSGLEGVDFNNMDKLKILQNFKQSDVDRMNEMFDVLNKINSIDTSKLNSLQKLFTDSTLKFKLDGDAVLKSTINIDVAGDKMVKLIDERIKLVTKRQNAPK